MSPLHCKTILYIITDIKVNYVIYSALNNLDTNANVENCFSSAAAQRWLDINELQRNKMVCVSWIILFIQELVCMQCCRGDYGGYDGCYIH